MRDIESVKTYFENLQEQVCQAFEERELTKKFSSEAIDSENGAKAKPKVLEDGVHVEKAAVQYTYSKGTKLPAAATERNQSLAGKSFEAASVSMIIHPRNPFVPTFHANLRFFVVNDDHWHFGGGFDLTPFYPFPEDVLHWHLTAKSACDIHNTKFYRRFKKNCDDYFYLPHRKEHRGVGGIFFDDWSEGGFEKSFELTKSIGDAILQAYLPIFDRRVNLNYTEREREFQLYRRGRYAEFNLAIDRGTKYGMQSGRRIESVLASMPPVAKWIYNWTPEPGSPESDLYENYLQSRDWISELSNVP